MRYRKELYSQTDIQYLLQLGQLVPYQSVYGIQVYTDLRDKKLCYFQPTSGGMGRKVQAPLNGLQLLLPSLSYYANIFNTNPPTPTPPTPTPPAADSLLTNLISYYKLQTNLLDTVGTNHLTANGNAATFTSIQDTALGKTVPYLDITANSPGCYQTAASNIFDATKAFTIAGWVNRNNQTTSSSNVIVTLFGDPNGSQNLNAGSPPTVQPFDILPTASYLPTSTSNGRYQLDLVSNNVAKSGTSGNQTIPAYGDLVILQYNGAFQMSVGSSAGSASVALTYNPTNGRPFAVGDAFNSTTATFPYVNRLGIWQRQLTNAELTRLRTGISYDPATQTFH
jgi:hypothetical protein